jgi:7-carboxy-7-deazaguanine synthase
MTQLTLPISESFHSLQGEGTFCGTPMHFIRTAGCNVGRHPETITWEIGQDRNFPILKTGKTAYVCHTYDGRKFWCDTDFQSSEKVSVRELLDNTWEKHICFTGGEPLLHKDTLDELIDEAGNRGIMTHIETSGTLDWEPKGICWITCSPKQHYSSLMIQLADEIKLLIDKDFHIEDVTADIREHDNVWVQPINNELSIDFDNFKRCQDILRIKPEWRLSVQLHKFLNIR